MNAMTRPTARRSRMHALLLATGLAVSGASAWARGPADTELNQCVAKAERYFATDASRFRVRDAEMFRQHSGRQVLALDLELAGGLRPRFYCVLDTDGRVSSVQTLPRLPGNGGSMLVAK